MLEEGLDRKYNYPGIYSISIGDNVVYIGKSKNMLNRVAEHISYICIPNDQNKYKVLHQAKERGLTIKFDVIKRLTAESEFDIDQTIGLWEAEAIQKYRPLLNYQIPKTENYHSFEVNRPAKYVTLDALLEICQSRKNMVE